MISTLKQQVQNYILENSDLDKKTLYLYIQRKFQIPPKLISAYYLELEKKGMDKIPPVNLDDKQIKKILKQEGENLHISVTLDFEVRTLEDLLAACEVDGEKWEVISWQCKKWDLGIKNAQEAIETKKLFSVSAKFRPRKVDSDLKLQKQVILEELFSAAPSQDLLNSYHYFAESYKQDDEKPYLLELALFDVHFGKMAHREECGADYDLKIAVAQYKDAIKDILTHANINTVGRILFPIGNDMINIDNIQSTTTAGTPQTCDSRFHKIVRTVKQLLIETINELAVIAPVDVVVVVGNHDEQTTFMIGEMLEAYYHNSQRVDIQNTAAPRKYYQYGTVGFMLTHGNKEKHANLGMIFAAENPKLWGATTQRYVQLGHFHSNKKINYIANEEFQGFQIQIMPSLSGSDAWHAGKGFISLKQAKGLIYHKEKGLIGELTYTV